jgi:hypothetical protein
VGAVDVSHGGAGGDAEHAHEVDRVGGLAGFVADAVLPDLLGGEATLLEGLAEDAVCDWRVTVVHGCQPGDEQAVRVPKASSAALTSMDE